MSTAYYAVTHDAANVLTMNNHLVPVVRWYKVPNAKHITSIVRFHSENIEHLRQARKRLIAGTTYTFVDVAKSRRIPTLHLNTYYRTAGDATVKCIAIHPDGDCEMTVIKYPKSVPKEQVTIRGVREGSSYMVDKFGFVKPGHCAPPDDMVIIESVGAVVTGTDKTVTPPPWASWPGIANVTHPPVYDDTQLRKELIQLLSTHKVEVAAMFDELKTCLTSRVEKELTAAVTQLAQHHVQHTKKLEDVVKARDDGEDTYIAAIVEGLVRTHLIRATRVGDVWSTKNGSRVQIVKKFGDGSFTGKVTRGGSPNHGWGQTIAYRRDGTYSIHSDDMTLTTFIGTEDV